MENITFTDFGKRSLNIIFLVLVLTLYPTIVSFNGSSNNALVPPSNYVDTDGDGISDDKDLDDDGDGIIDTVEDSNKDGDGSCTTQPSDQDNDGIPDYLDIDSDNDGIIDNVEAQTTEGYIPPSCEDKNHNGLDDAYEVPYGNCEGLTPVDTDGDGVPDYKDVDSDNDGIIDNVEAQSSADFIALSGKDYNQNGLDDAYEPQGDGTCDFNGKNSNYKGADKVELCHKEDKSYKNPRQGYHTISVAPAAVQAHLNHGDTLGACEESCPFIGGLQPVDTDSDGIADYRDIDSDDDGIVDNIEAQHVDNYIPPSGMDTDGNGLDDQYEEYPGSCGGIVPINSDQDPLPNFRDIDSDDDGIPDNVEGQTTAGYIPPSGNDTDQDGLDDAYENDGIIPVDTDGDGTPDYLDDDTDNDLVADNNEGNDFNFDGIPDQTYTGTDTDNDGLDDGYEGSDINDGYDVNDEIDDPANDLPDTDGTEDVNYRDIDDDGDGIDTPDEDADGDGDPTNDDTDEDGTPDYLDPDMGNVIDAVDDTFVTDGSGGTVPDANMLDNDTLDGGPVTLEDVILTSTPTDELTINEDGSVTVAEGTPEGTYTIEYTICEIADPDNCDTATVTVTVDPGMGNVIDAVDDTFATDGSGGTVPDANVLDNDTLDGGPVTLEDVILTSTPTDELTINPDGSVTVAEGTPEGTYTIEYTICEIADPDNCDTGTVTVTVDPGMGNVIDAVDDTFVTDGSGGTVPDANVLDNDTLDGGPVTLEDVILTSTPTDELTINPDGSVTVAEGTPEGTYTIEYTICEIADPDNCDTATVTVTVDPGMGNVIDAVDDTFVTDGSGGTVPDANVLDNDTLDGGPVTLEDVILTSTPTDELTINPDGSVTVAEGTPEGTYTIEYTICEIADPDNCDTGTVTVMVDPGMGNVIDAVDDTFATDGSGGTVPDANVLDNDTLDGGPVTLEDVILTSTPTDELTINPDGSVTVAEGTPEGTYTIEYTICEIADPDNCDTGTVTVTVDPGMGNVIDAVDDTFVTDGTGGTVPDANVLDNDTLDGGPVTLEDVILTSTPTDELTINPDGSVTVAEGTPEGTYTIEYTICEIADPDNCDTGTVTVTVDPGMGNVIDAVDDTFVTDGSGGTVPDANVLDNDTLDGGPVTLEDVILTSTPTDELTINADGSVSVAEGTPEGTYTIEYTICEIADPDNCDTGTVTVLVEEVPEDEEIEVNQMLTPNGDLKNDFLFIRGVSKIKSSTLRIFNRWGVAVYEGEDYDNVRNVFDGRSRGRSSLSVNDYLPAGVYFYIFDYETDKGSFTDSEYIYISR
ncbi:gliding motility-associated C-terminal domain-containing protein [Flagellimonas meishanensis]|uniref:T9SS type B sorting domain-containing protein n=1 Tax=Flagellimonas meishanensis TaxID=2873264 RepID=UPI001CA6CB2A|nr:gliding motility-associated C-terminal domain-containing protein [[Muricauda] meishanensis]